MSENKPLQETIAVFHDAGLAPEVQRGRKHIEVQAKKCSRTIFAVVGATPSDQWQRGLSETTLGEPRVRQSRKRIGHDPDEDRTGSVPKSVAKNWEWLIASVAISKNRMSASAFAEAKFLFRMRRE